MKQAKVEIKRTYTSEENISKRTVRFEIYVGGEYLTHFDDILDAMDYKEHLEQLTEVKGKVQKMLKKDYKGQITIDGNNWHIGEAHFIFGSEEIDWIETADYVVFNRIRNYLKRVK